MKFAKLFELKNGEQMLVTTLTEDEELKINFETDFNEFRASVKIGFDNEEAQRKAFDRISQDNAEGIRADLEKQLQQS